MVAEFEKILNTSRKNSAINAGSSVANDPSTAGQSEDAEMTDTNDHAITSYSSQVGPLWELSPGPGPSIITFDPETT